MAVSVSVRPIKGTGAVFFYSLWCSHAEPRELPMNSIKICTKQSELSCHIHFIHCLSVACIDCLFKIEYLKEYSFNILLNERASLM